MKTIMLLLAVLSFGAMADDKCSIEGEIASSAMKLRQAGATVSQVMNITKDEGWKPIVIAAFKKPMMQSASMKLQATNEFGNQYALKCYENE